MLSSQVLRVGWAILRGFIVLSWHISSVWFIARAI